MSEQNIDAARLATRIDNAISRRLAAKSQRLAAEDRVRRSQSTTHIIVPRMPTHKERQ